MKFQCSVSNCSYKLEDKGKLYFFPNPVNNKPLFDKWVQTVGRSLDNLDDLFVYKNRFICANHYQDLNLKKHAVFEKHLSDNKLKQGPCSLSSEFKMIDNEVKSVDVRKCIAVKPKVVPTLSRPLYVLKKQKIDGKEKPALLVLQRINKTSQKVIDPTQSITDVKDKDPLECVQGDRDITGSTTATTETNKRGKITVISLDKLIQNTSHAVVNTVDTTELIQEHNKKDTKYEHINKDVFKRLGHPIFKTTEQKQTPEIIKPIPKYGRLIMPRYQSNNDGINTKAAKPDVIERYDGLPLTKSSEVINLNTKTEKPTILNEANSTAVKAHVQYTKAMKVTQKRQSAFVLSNTMKLDNIQNSQMEETEKIVSSQTNVDRNYDMGVHLSPDIYAVASEVEVSEVDDSQVDVLDDVTEDGVQESDIIQGEVPKVSDVGVQEVEVPKVVEPKIRDIKMISVSGGGPKNVIVNSNVPLKIGAQANLMDKEVCTGSETNGNVVKRLKTYLKKSSCVPAANPPRLTPSPVDTPCQSFASFTKLGSGFDPGAKWPRVGVPREKPGPGDEWRALISGLISDKPSATKTGAFPSARRGVKTGPGILRVRTEAVHSRLSQASVPIFTGPVDRWYMATDDFKKILETIQSRPTAQEKLAETLQVANLSNLPYAEGQRMRRLIISYHEQYQKLKNMIKTLEKQLNKKKITIALLKKRLSAARVNSKSKAFEKLTSDMTEDAKLIMRMHVVHHKKRPRARRFSLKEKLFSLSLYKLSKQAYLYMSRILSMPTIKTLIRFLNNWHTKLLVNDGAATDNISQELKDGAGMHEKPRENNETVAAVAAINVESLTDNLNTHTSTENIEMTTNNEHIEYSANGIIYTNVEPYIDGGYVQTDCTDFNTYASESVYTMQCVDQTDDQNCNVIEIPTNYETISLSYDGTQELSQLVLSENTVGTSPLKIENLPNDIKYSSKSINKKIQQAMIDEKKRKIDFVLSKMMTPEQLKNFTARPRKKKLIKTNGELKKKVKESKLQRIDVTGITKSTPKIKKDNNVKIMKYKRKLKKTTPSSSYHAQSNTNFITQFMIPQSAQVITDRNNTEMTTLGTIAEHDIDLHQSVPSIVQHVQYEVITDESYMPESISDSDKVITGRYHSGIYVPGTSSKHKRDLQQNGVNEHTIEKLSTSVQVIANEDNSEINSMDTVTKLRRNLEKYSPKAMQSNISFIDASCLSQRTLGSERIMSNINVKKEKPTDVSQLGKKPIKIKRKLVIDGSQSFHGSSRKYPRPEMFVLGTRDVRPTKFAIAKSVKISPQENVFFYEKEEPVGVKGVDMPDLGRDFNSTFHNKNRKKFGFKRLPTNPY